MTIFSDLRNRFRAGGGAAQPSDVPRTAAETDVPFPGYERLDSREVMDELHHHSQAELAAIEAYERAHEARLEVLDKLRYMRGSEPLPGYDALSAEEIVDLLADADMPTVKRIRAYERKFANRPLVLDEVVRVHHRLYGAQPAEEAPAYQPAGRRD